MGADFIEKATPTFKKSWDRARVDLVTADLFTRQPSCAGRTAVAEIVGGAPLRVGDRLVVELRGDSLVALRGNTEVARLVEAPSELVRAVQDSCGLAKGLVEQVHDLAGVAEVSLC